MDQLNWHGDEVDKGIDDVLQKWLTAPTMSDRLAKFGQWLLQANWRWDDRTGTYYQWNNYAPQCRNLSMERLLEIYRESPEGKSE
jgi:hypothetical protein